MMLLTTSIKFALKNEMSDQDSDSGYLPVNMLDKKFEHLNEDKEISDDEVNLYLPIISNEVNEKVAKNPPARAVLLWAFNA